MLVLRNSSDESVRRVFLMGEIMEKSSKRIAFYGKGGIGKSTIAANVSVAFAKMGKRVLHIGCDPKSDSTRCLMKKRIPTVIQRLNEKGEQLTAQDILFMSETGVACVEAGGPEAGIGCAGMGIATTLETLEKLGIFETGWDLITYDVLGDVVCGGFSMPMRKKCVDQVYIVTSSELMSLYAANNIMKSIVRYSEGTQPLFGGLIHKRASPGTDHQVVECFGGKTGSPITASVCQSDTLRLADYRRTTVFEQREGEALQKSFMTLAKAIASQTGGICPKPLADADMDNLGETLYQLEKEDRHGRSSC